MAERNATGVEKSSSLANLKDKGRDGSPSGKPPSNTLNKNPSQKAGDLSPLTTRKEDSKGSSVQRKNTKSKRGSEAESGSPTKRMNSKAGASSGAGAAGGLGEGRAATKVSIIS